MDIRQPDPTEFDALADLCFRSKAYWGYDEAFMALSRPVLQINPALAELGLSAAAYDGGTPVGVAQVELDGADVELDLLFVEPSRMGEGVGAALFDWARTIAKEHGATLMWILSDPQARPFYEKMGAYFVADAPSDAIPGRLLPRLKIGL